MTTTTMMTTTTTTTLLLFLVIMTLMTSISAFTRRSSNNQIVNNELIQTLRTMRRGGKQCFGAGTKCFSSIQCCHGFVCAAFDDYSGENPEIPGFCVKEKDLQLCVTDEDCNGGGAGEGTEDDGDSSFPFLSSSSGRSVCQGFGRGTDRYCLSETIRNEIDPLSSPIAHQKFSHVVYYPVSGRLGSVCKTSADCNLTTESSVPLCCKDVRRGRQGVKRMCDKLETPSPCL